MVMACRYAYYVLTKSILTDYEYDALEKDYTMVNGPLPVGSSNKADYTEAQRALALYFLLSGRFVSCETKTTKPKTGEELL
jgi:hypothetical protein